VRAPERLFGGYVFDLDTEIKNVYISTEED
jgi:hypothetical protein